MLELIGLIRPAAEILYFISGIVLTYGLWITYGQLKSIRKDSIDRSVRASKEKAIEASSIFLSRAIPKIDAAYAARKSAGIAEKIKGKGPDFVINLSSDTEWMTSDNCKSAIKICLEACNEIEAVASYFTSAVADEGTGFNIFGRGFCESVESNYKIICIGKLYQTDPAYKSITELYNLWSPRIEAGELSKKIKDLQDHVAGIEKSKSKPISPKK